MRYKKENDKVDKGRYQRVVKRLTYLAHTMSDLEYAIKEVSQFINDLRVRHLQMVECVIQYLKVTLGKGHLFKRGGRLNMKAYTNVDYASSLIDIRSISGYCTFFYENIVA